MTCWEDTFSKRFTHHYTNAQCNLQRTNITETIMKSALFWIFVLTINVAFRHLDTRNEQTSIFYTMHSAMMSHRDAFLTQLSQTITHNVMQLQCCAQSPVFIENSFALLLLYNMLLPSLLQASPTQATCSWASCSCIHGGCKKIIMGCECLGN